METVALLGGLLSSGLIGVVGWLFKTVLDQRVQIAVLQEQRQSEVEALEKIFLKLDKLSDKLDSLP